MSLVLQFEKHDGRQGFFESLDLRYGWDEHEDPVWRGLMARIVHKISSEVRMSLWIFVILLTTSLGLADGVLTSSRGDLRAVDLVSKDDDVLVEVVHLRLFVLQ